MQTKAGAGPHRLERLVRVVPPLSLLVLLLLAALLLAASSARATSQAAPSTAPVALEEEGEEEDELEAEAEEEEACGEAEEEFEEGEAGEAEVEALCEMGDGEGRARGSASGSTALERCPLRSVRTRAVVRARGRRLKLTVGYTTYEPTGATVEISRGRTRIGSFRRHLGRSGVLRIVKRLVGDLVPRQLVVRLRIADSPGECAGRLTHRVRIRRAR